MRIMLLSVQLPYHTRCPTADNEDCLHCLMLNQQYVRKFGSVSHLRKYNGYMVWFKIIIINYAKNNGNYVLFPAQLIYFSIF